MLLCNTVLIDLLPFTQSGIPMIRKVKLKPSLKLIALFFTFPAFMTACSNAKTVSAKPTSKELYLISHPSKPTITKINTLIPHAMTWYNNVEKTLYSKGRPLTTSEKKMAKVLGVRNPGAVRVVILDKFPEPTNKTVNNHFEGARAMGNIIMIKPRHKNDSIVLCHELVHVAQKDRMGLKKFLTRYALEREVLGYSRSLLENEAYARQQAIQ